MFHLIWICFLEILNNNPSNRIFKKLTLILILTLKETHHFRKASCQRHSKDQTNHFFQNLKELGDLINKENLVHKFLPKQTDINKMLEVIQRKVLKGTHLPVEVKEIQEGYLHSPYFKDLYMYLLQNKLPSSKSAIRKFTIVQNITRKRDSSSSNTRNVHGQDNNPMSQKFICRTPRSN